MTSQAFDQPSAGAPLESSAARPLIHDLMPASDQTTRAATVPTAPAISISADRQKVGPEQTTKPGFIDMPPIDYGSSSINIARPIEKSALKPESKPDPFKTTGDELVQIANANVNKDLTVAPRGAEVSSIPKKFGCAATLSNLLLKDHKIDAKEFQNNVDGLEKLLVNQIGATHIDAPDLKKGDIVVGRDQKDGSGGRHVGVVDVDAKGKLVVLNNWGGHLKRDDLKTRFFDKYNQVYGLRLPPT
jgi:hypothetical protein